MGKTTLMILLLALNNTALAGWIELTSAGKETYFVNPDTIHRDENLVKMWSVANVKESKLASFLKELDKVLSIGSTKMVMSEVVRKEYDCKAGKSRQLNFSTYSERMGEGETITTDFNPGKWETVVPGSVEESLFEYACDPCYSTKKFSPMCRDMQ